MLTGATSSAATRIDWVDYAKGICIILVVMMHSTLGVEKAAGELSWLNGFIEWARPFRMPDFFLISGLFLAARIDRPWRTYLDTKLLHFAYFYILWMTIQYGMKSWGIIQAEGPLAALQAYGLGFVQPFGTLWFIYLLAIFFVAAKALRRFPPLLVFAVAAVLEMAPIETGWLVIDEFAGRFVYFFAGYWLAPHIFAFAREVGGLNPLAILAGLLAWGAINGILVVRGWSHLPGIGLALGFIGASAVISASVLLARVKLAGVIRYCGQQSIVIYLAFFMFMAATRTVLLKTGLVDDLALVSLIVTLAGVAGPVLLYLAVRKTPLSFLFIRPQWARLPATLRKSELVSSQPGRLEA
ncbi:acyltransferase family protein [Nordella sp. HKS 07]|uniref:acyltransferase family protein n=1 Tax=Nordella sp. HKS 07 TaxID=2712222 RepID=UPI0013E10791|nr:acyltransferase family protein [Nordella sp. HKS 07]QIG48324.1 acyltransferase family protein [Nordella sp. HKS 07]